MQRIQGRKPTIHYSLVKQPSVFPRIKSGVRRIYPAEALAEAGSQCFAGPLTIRARAPRSHSSFPQRGGAERRDGAGCVARQDARKRADARHPWRAVRLARRDACEASRVPKRKGDARLSALYHGDFRPWAALPSPGLSPGGRTAMLLAAGSWCPAGGSQSLPGAPVTSRSPRDATPGSAFGTSPETPLDEPGCESLYDLRNIKSI